MIWENIVLVQAKGPTDARKKATKLGNLHARKSAKDADIAFKGIRAIVDVLPSPTGKADWNEIIESGAEVACNKLAFSSRKSFKSFMRKSMARAELLW
jgi:hypothetical protein